MICDTFSPLVSVVIPVYNGANFMREAIDSALAQTYKNVEVIVVNDGSTDQGETDRIAKEYGDKIRYIQKENGGVSTALNAGICNMTGEYFSWLSHDDVYTPDKIEKQILALSKQTDKRTLVCCKYVHINEKSEIIGGKTKPALNETKFYTWEQMLADLFQHGPVNGCSLLIHKSVFDTVGLFDETLRFYQDGFMWYKIFMAKYNVLAIPDICVKGRIHGKQLTQTGQALFRKDCEAMSHVMIPQLAEISTRQTNFLLAYLKYHAKYGNKNVVKNAQVIAKNAGLISFKDFLAIETISAYGAIRPLMRKIYYAITRGIQTA